MSDIPFRLTRKGSGRPLRITADAGDEPPQQGRLVVEWRQRPGHPFHGKVYREGGLLRVWTSDAGWFAVDPAVPAIAMPASTSSLQAEVRLWSTPTMLLLKQQGGLLLHASAAEVDGKAVLFGGPSRFGKTTLAAAMHTAGHRVLAEDTTYLVPTADSFAVVPGPALLRVRHDVFDVLDLDDVEVLGADSQRKFVAPRSEERGTCDPVPLGGLFLLRSDPEQVRIEAVASTSTVLPDLWALAFKLPGDDDHRRVLGDIVAFAETAAIWNLHRPMQLDRIGETVAAASGMVS